MESEEFKQLQKKALEQLQTGYCGRFRALNLLNPYNFETGYSP